MLSPAMTWLSSPISVMILDWEITTGMVPAIAEPLLAEPAAVTRMVWFLPLASTFTLLPAAWVAAVSFAPLPTLAATVCSNTPTLTVAPAAGLPPPLAASAAMETTCFTSPRASTLTAPFFASMPARLPTLASVSLSLTSTPMMPAALPLPVTAPEAEARTLMRFSSLSALIVASFAALMNAPLPALA